MAGDGDMDWLAEALRTVVEGRLDVIAAGDLASVGPRLLFGLCAFVLGATIGSFLNVVVYRLPRGLSPAAGRSACPACGGRIRATDNLPVISWFLLRGRCRLCGAAIPARYPLVEFGCGAMFLALAITEVLAADPGRGPWWTPLDERPEFVVRFLYHALSASAVIAWWLVEIEGGAIAWRYAAGVIAVALVTPLVFPSVHSVVADEGIVWPIAFIRTVGEAWPPTQESRLGRGLLVSLLGVALAIVVAAAMERLRGRSSATLVGLVLVGVVLGWQGVAWAAGGILLAAGLGNHGKPRGKMAS